MNLKHGERLGGNLLFPNVAFCMSYIMFCDCYRLSYCVWMLQEMLEQTRGKSIDLYLMYDVACMLQKHLQVCYSGVFLTTFGELICLLGC